MINIGLIRQLVNTSLPPSILSFFYRKNTSVSSFWIIAYGGLCFELIHYAIMVILSRSLSVDEYALFGALYSATLMMSKCLDAGWSFIIAPFQSYFFRDRESFLIMLTSSACRLPLGVIFVCASVGAAWFTFFFNLPSIFFGIFLSQSLVGVVLDGVRMILYVRQQSRMVVVLELSTAWSFLMVVSMMWGAGVRFELVTVSCGYLAYLLVITALLMRFMIAEGDYLSISARGVGDEIDLAHVRRYRWQAYAVRLGRNLFSRYTLTPFFAGAMSLHHGAIFFMASNVISLLHRALKMAIYYATYVSLASSTRSAAGTIIAACSQQLYRMGIACGAICVAIYGSAWLSGMVVFDVFVNIIVLYGVLVLIELFIMMHEQRFLLAGRALPFLAVRTLQAVVMLWGLYVYQIQSMEAVLWWGVVVSAGAAAIAASYDFDL